MTQDYEAYAKYKDLIPPPRKDGGHYDADYTFNIVTNIAVRMGWMKFSDWEINQRYHALKTKIYQLKTTLKKYEEDLEAFEKDYQAPRARVPDIPL